MSNKIKSIPWELAVGSSVMIATSSATYENLIATQLRLKSVHCVHSCVGDASTYCVDRIFSLVTSRMPSPLGSVDSAIRENLA
jgi:hypothetical protein